MFKRLFGLGSDPNREIVGALYDEIVAAARQPVLYAVHGAPDTPLGRFEMLSLHMILFLERVAREQGPIEEISQELTDAFFLEVDHSLRELGIGDTSVPKRMKTLARMFYGRSNSYSAALRGSDVDALAAALARNVRPGGETWPGAHSLAAHALAVHGSLAAQSIADIERGVMDMRTIAGQPERAA